MSRSVHGGWSPTIPLVQESPVDAVIAREMLARFAEALQSHGIAWCRASRPRTRIGEEIHEDVPSNVGFSPALEHPVALQRLRRVAFATTGTLRSGGARGLGTGGGDG